MAIVVSCSKDDKIKEEETLNRLVKDGPWIYVNFELTRIIQNTTVSESDYETIAETSYENSTIEFKPDGTGIWKYKSDITTSTGVRNFEDFSYTSANGLNGRGFVFSFDGVVVGIYEGIFSFENSGL